MVAIVIFLVVLLNGGAGQKPELVIVPNLVGETYEDLPELENFSVKIDQEVHDNEIPAGQIISQTPLGDAQIEKNEKNDTIYVVVSLGEAEQIVYMPNVENWELAQAEKNLNGLSMNLQLEIEEDYSDTVTKGSVIRTEPAADKELEVGQQIKLVVSLGVEIKTSAMPNVVGDKLESAKKILVSQGLDLEIEQKDEFNSLVPAGDVIRTDPAVGVELKTGQKVTIYYSKGAELATMPNVTGIDIDKAVSILVNSGFKNYQIEQVESNEDKDTVVKQSVEKNTEVDINTEIVLEVSMGPAEVPEITKDVVINLRGSAKGGECQVTVKRGDTVVFKEKVPQGTETITLTSQTGSGTVYYEVI